MKLLEKNFLWNPVMYGDNPLEIERFVRGD